MRIVADDAEATDVPVRVVSYEGDGAWSIERDGFDPIRLQIPTSLTDVWNPEVGSVLLFTSANLAGPGAFPLGSYYVLYDAASGAVRLEVGNVAPAEVMPPIARMAYAETADDAACTNRFGNPFREGGVALEADDEVVTLSPGEVAEVVLRGVAGRFEVYQALRNECTDCTDNRVPESGLAVFIAREGE